VIVGFELAHPFASKLFNAVAKHTSSNSAAMVTIGDQNQATSYTCVMPGLAAGA
jgi:hypothetical protein